MQWFGVGHWLTVHYHKNWVDACTWATAFLYMTYKCCRRRNFGIAARGFMDGAAIFPLFLLFTAAIWRSGVTGLLEASRLTLSIAGLFALLAVLQADDKEPD